MMSRRMPVSVLGTGQVGGALARRLAALGYDVMIAGRNADSPTLAAFSAAAPELRTGSFVDALGRADFIINATNGRHSVAALGAAGHPALSGKTVLDVANDLEPVPGGFPQPTATASESLGARLQAEFPQAHIIKALNTMNYAVMVDPTVVPGDHVVFLSGDDESAKQRVREVLASLGWRETQMVDLGGIDTAASTEMLMSLWMNVTLARGAGMPRFNWAINAP